MTEMYTRRIHRKTGFPERLPKQISIPSGSENNSVTQKIRSDVSIPLPNIDSILIKDTTHFLSGGEDLGALPQAPLKTFLKEGFKNSKNFPEKGVSPFLQSDKIYNADEKGDTPFSGKFFGSLNLSFKKGLGGVSGSAPRSWSYLTFSANTGARSQSSHGTIKSSLPM